MSGESLNPDLDYAIKDHKILPMIVIDLCGLDFHLGRGICADRGKKPWFPTKKSKMTCYLAAYAINCYHSSPRNHWVGVESDAAK